MDKAKINYLLKSGFTLDEIMKLEPPEEEKKTETKPEEQKKSETKPETKPEEADSVSKMIADLKKEISEMRTAIHTENRLTSAVEKPEKQTSFEDDIEKMIEEVTN